MTEQNGKLQTAAERGENSLLTRCRKPQKRATFTASRPDGGVVTQRTANPPTGGGSPRNFAIFTLCSSHGFPRVSETIANSWRRWKRLPRTYDEIHAQALGYPDPLAGWGVPYPGNDVEIARLAMGGARG